MVHRPGKSLKSMKSQCTVTCSLTYQDSPLGDVLNKCEISHFLVIAPHWKVWNLAIFYFNEEQTNAFLKEKYICLYKPIDILTLEYPKLSYFPVRWYPLPPKNIIFFAELQELEQVKINVKMTQICTDPPSLMWNFTIFFQLRNFPWFLN